MQALEMLAVMTTTGRVKMIQNNVWDVKLAPFAASAKSSRCRLVDSKTLMDWTRDVGLDRFKSLAQFMQDHMLCEKSLGETRIVDGVVRTLRLRASFSPLKEELIVTTSIE